MSELPPQVAWMLLAGFLALVAHAGFAMIETGLCRAKNAAHTVSMNLMVYALGCLGFWAYGFAIGWGDWAHGAHPPGWAAALGPESAALDRGLGFGTPADSSAGSIGGHAYGLMGTRGFFLNGLDAPAILALFFLMMMLMSIMATIPTGVLAERWHWKSFCLYGLWAALPFSLHANWVWGGGWLAQAGRNWRLGHGAVDFAGSGAIHALGGAIALAGAIAIGPRVGKFSQGRPQPLPGHHVPMVGIGSFLLAVGWFGMNAGMTLSGSDLRLAAIAVNTVLASAAGAAAAMLTLQAKRMKADPTMMCNGLAAGLVAISAPCAFVDSWAAVTIGAVAGMLAVLGILVSERCGLDDPVGAISTHGIGGIWGLLAVGLFANGRYGAGWNGVARDEFVGRFQSDGVRGLLFGDASQLAAQSIDVAVVLLLGFGLGYAWFKLSNLAIPLRVPRNMELEGLDGPEMGALGYPDFM
jgi:Amt family ammonium transporter